MYHIALFKNIIFYPCIEASLFIETLITVKYASLCSVHIHLYKHYQISATL